MRRARSGGSCSAALDLHPIRIPIFPHVVVNTRYIDQPKLREDGEAVSSPLHAFDFRFAAGWAAPFEDPIPLVKPAAQQARMAGGHESDYLYYEQVAREVQEKQTLA